MNNMKRCRRKTETTSHYLNELKLSRKPCLCTFIWLLFNIGEVHKREENMHKAPKMHHVMPLAKEPNPHLLERQGSSIVVLREEIRPKSLYLFIKDKEMLTCARTLG